MHRKLLVHGLLVAGAAFLMAGTARAAEATDTADYLGVKSCKMCHSKIYTAWAETKHAKAFATLKGADEKTVAAQAAKAKVEAKSGTDEACLKCHVTGLGKKTGFAMADSTKVANLGGVTCEACHGPGSKHKAAAKEDKKKMINHSPSKELCMGCHTPEMSPKFDYDTWKTKVHAVAAAK